MRNNFAAIILSHGRPEKVVTYKTLRSHGYTGRIVILIDDLDKTADQYKKNFGDQVYVFDKKRAKEISDSGNNFNDYRSTTFVRNMMFEVAKDLGIDTFIQLDDDYIYFKYKFDSKLNYINDSLKRTNNLDDIFDVLADFVKNTPVKSLCFAQGGDFIGGQGSWLAQRIRSKRKGMNSFVCSTEKPFKFYGQMNEDVNGVITGGQIGDIFLMTNQIALEQLRTQKNPGGMSEIYLDSGTYFKTFYSVMYCPSAAKVHYLNSANKRIHHKISWKNVAPKILREEIKQKSSLFF